MSDRPDQDSSNILSMGYLDPDEPQEGDKKHVDLFKSMSPLVMADSEGAMERHSPIELTEEHFMGDLSSVPSNYDSS